MNKEDKFERIEDILHSYLDDPCLSCIWRSNTGVCDLDPDCDWKCRDDRIEDMTKEIMETI